MNDEQFLELMNLYIDGELHGEERDQLENEISKHPGRRTLYREYCRIHAATRAHYNAFALPDAHRRLAGIRAVQRAVHQDGDRMITFPLRWAGWAAGLAAACVAGVLGLQQLGYLGRSSNTAHDQERPAMTVRETRSIEAPISGLLASQEAPVDLNDPYQHPFSLVRLEPDEQQGGSPEGGGAFIHHYRVQMQRSSALAPANAFGFERSVPSSRSRVFRSGFTREEENLRLAPVGYLISR